MKSLFIAHTLLIDCGKASCQNREVNSRVRSVKAADHLITAGNN